MMPFDLAGIVAACFLKSATMGSNMEMQTAGYSQQGYLAAGSYHGAY